MGELRGRLGPDGELERPIISLSSMIDSSPVATMVLDLEGKLILFNHAAHSMLDLDDSQLGKPISALDLKGAGEAIGSRNDTFQLALQRAKEKGRSILRMTILSSLQSHRTYDFTINILKDEKGACLGALVSIQESYSFDFEGNEASPETLAVMSSEVTDGDDLAGAISNELGELVESLNLDFAVLRLTNMEGRASMLFYGVDRARGQDIMRTRFRDEGFLYDKVLKGDLFISEDVPNDPRIADPPQGIQSLVCISIQWTRKVYGCAMFGSTLPGLKVKSFIPVLQVFCNQAAISIGNVALWKELAGRNSELRALYETSKALSSSLELKEVLKTILQTSRSLVGSTNCSIFSMENSVRKLRCVAYIGDDKELTEGVELRVGEGVTGLVAQKGEGMLIRRADLDGRTIHIAGSKDAPSSLISVPLKISDKIVGVMTLERVLGSPYDEKEYQLIEMFSVQAAAAVYNASLFSLQKSTASNLQMFNTLLTHDVANFNVPIHSYLEMLLSDPKLDERQRRFVWNSLIQSENISELVSDVRELTRLKSRLGEKPLEPIDIIPIINEAIGDIQTNLLYGDIDITFESSLARNAVVECDSFMKSLFYNLLSNACKYGEGSAVRVKVIPSKDQGLASWRIEISDGGKGISNERKSQLFKRFDQLDSDQGADGHGIGLSVVKALCDRYGGRVWVEDRIPGNYSKGATFVVTLPEADTPPLESTGMGGELAGVK